MPKRKSPSNKTRSVKMRNYEKAYKACIKKALESVKSSKKSAKSTKSTKSTSTKSKSSTTKSKSTKSPKTTVRRRTTREKRDTPKTRQSSGKPAKRKRKLTAYQLYIQKEMKKSKYKGLPNSTKMKMIAETWNAKKK